jgi:hypothetical protein
MRTTLWAALFLFFPFFLFFFFFLFSFVFGVAGEEREALLCWPESGNFGGRVLNTIVYLDLGLSPTRVESFFFLLTTDPESESASFGAEQLSLKLRWHHKKKRKKGRRQDTTTR